RFMTPPPAPRATIAEIVPASALLPMPGARVRDSGPTPSQRAEMARRAADTPVSPEPKKPPPPKEPRGPQRPKPDPTVPPLEAKKPAEPSPSAPEPAPAEIPEPEAAAPGGISFGGTGLNDAGIPTIGSSAFPYDYYRASLVSILQSNWRRPVAPEGLAETVRCRVQFTILKSGIVQDPRIVAPSGNQALDQSAVRAVYDSNPLPPLPFQYGHGSVSAEVVFELTPE
ncbi:MAG TPA: energy transducer TonB, partial [Candidatus Polarisedimenticolia bacterium]|nr:energy transducer TonB [Candidatus Polarisedimenticolia bacterium]